MAQFHLQNTSLSVKVNSLGAELCSVYSKVLSLEYIWQADKTVWARYAPNLFPIVGKLKGGTYQYNGSSYSLPQHGFARDNEFTCVKQTDTEIILELKDSEDFKLFFPFSFVFQVRYHLRDNELSIEYNVINTDTKDLLFSVGAHPAFNCPLFSNETFQDYELVFNDKKELVINALADGLITDDTKTIHLTNHTLPVNKDLFMNDALVFKHNQFNEVIVRSVKSQHGVKLTANNWPYFGIWSKKDSDQFVCLEPWYGIADSISSNGLIEEKEGIIKLEPSKQFNAVYSIQFF